MKPVLEAYRAIYTPTTLKALWARAVHEHAWSEALFVHDLPVASWRGLDLNLFLPKIVLEGGRGQGEFRA